MRAAARGVGFLAALAALLAVPLWGNDYHVSVGIHVLTYAVLATAWGMFCGPARYISLATSALFGIGAYTVALLYERLAWPLLLLLGGVAGGAFAALVGLATLRLRGVYFTVFTFGLAELVRQVMTWYQRNVSGSVGVYVFLPASQRQIYWALVALSGLVVASALAVGHSRFGLALRMIGEDELAARHCGVRTTRLKVTVFAASSAFVALTGALVAPRWTYLDPGIAFDPTISFLTVVAALMGGTSHPLGPLAGVVPLMLVYELVTSRFPNHFMLLLGLMFIGVVYLLPGGLAGAGVRPATHRVPAAAAAVDGWTSPDACLSPPAPVERAASRDGRPDGAGRAGGAPGRVNPLLSVRGVTRRFGRLMALDHVSFDVDEGEVFGIIGPNGSGKSTLLNVISGALSPDRGAVELAGVRISARPPEEVAALGVGRTFQLVRIYAGLTCRDNVLAPLYFRRRPLRGRSAHRAAHELLARVGLEAQAEVPAGQLTYIDQKRLELARALALRPRLLLLDEWLAGLNPSDLPVAIRLLDLLREEGITIVLVEHIMTAIQALCDRCLVLNFGAVVAQGPPGEVLRHPEVLRAYLGEPDARG